jgi:hypothetical protein
MPTWLIHIIKSGEMSLFANDVKSVHLKAVNKKIDLNVIDKNFLKVVLQNMAEQTSFLNRLTQIKTIAEELKAKDSTITLSYKGGIALTLGSDANPKLSQLATRTHAIEVNSLRKLMQMGI